MGSWDAIDDPDYDGPPLEHQITCKSGYPGMNDGFEHSHPKVALVQGCYRAARLMREQPEKYFVCGDLVEVRGWEGDVYILPCPALAWITGRGMQCASGHEHVNIETRMAEGWEYAEDEGEAMALAGAGVEPRTMQGQIWPR